MRLIPKWSFDADSIFFSAINKWGQESQEGVAIGECGELIAEFGRKVQGRMELDDMIDEIADVTIMMRQLAIIYGTENVESRIEFKMKRLKSLVEE